MFSMCLHDFSLGFNSPKSRTFSLWWGLCWAERHLTNLWFQISALCTSTCGCKQTNFCSSLFQTFQPSAFPALFLHLYPFHFSSLLSLISPVCFSPSTADLAGCSEDSAVAAAGGEGLHQLLVLWDQADCLRGLRLPQREALPVPGWHRIHLPDQQQRLPLGLIRTKINKRILKERRAKQTDVHISPAFRTDSQITRTEIQRLPELMDKQS